MFYWLFCSLCQNFFEDFFVKLFCHCLVCEKFCVTYVLIVYYYARVHSLYTRVYHVHGTPKDILCTFAHLKLYQLCDYAHLEVSNEQRARNNLGCTMSMVQSGVWTKFPIIRWIKKITHNRMQLHWIDIIDLVVY